MFADSEPCSLKNIDTLFPSQDLLSCFHGNTSPGASISEWSRSSPAVYMTPQWFSRRWSMFLSFGLTWLSLGSKPSPTSDRETIPSNQSQLYNSGSKTSKISKLLLNMRFYFSHMRCHQNNVLSSTQQIFLLLIPNLKWRFHFTKICVSTFDIFKIVVRWFSHLFCSGSLFFTVYTQVGLLHETGSCSETRQQPLWRLEEERLCAQVGGGAGPQPSLCLLNWC